MITAKQAWLKLVAQYERKLAGLSGGWCCSTYICVNIDYIPGSTQAVRDRMKIALFQTFRPRTARRNYGSQAIWPMFKPEYDVVAGRFVDTPASERDAFNYGARATACAILAEGVSL